METGQATLVMHEEGVAMYARVTTGQLRLEKMGEAEQAGRAAATPMAQQPGFQGNMTLVDRQTGKFIIVGLWETEANLQATMEMHNAGHEQALAAGYLSAAPTVEVYEVVQRAEP